MAVSDEDRETARRAAYNEIDWDRMISVSPPDHNGSRVINLRSEQITRDVIAALIAHGWGPKPSVHAQRLNDLVTECALEVALWPLTHYLESNGIDVAE